MPIFVIQKQTIKITIMGKIYRITVFTSEEVIERIYHNREIAFATIMVFKERFDNYKIGILYEKIEEKWNPICSIVK